MARLLPHPSAVVKQYVEKYIKQGDSCKFISKETLLQDFCIWTGREICWSDFYHYFAENSSFRVERVNLRHVDADYYAWGFKGLEFLKNYKTPYDYCPCDDYDELIERFVNDMIEYDHINGHRLSYNELYTHFIDFYRNVEISKPSFISRFLYLSNEWGKSVSLSTYWHEDNKNIQSCDLTITGLIGSDAMFWRYY